MKKSMHTHIHADTHTEQHIYEYIQVHKATYAHRHRQITQYTNHPDTPTGQFFSLSSCLFAAIANQETQIKRQKNGQNNAGNSLTKTNSSLKERVLQQPSCPPLLAV